MVCCPPANAVRFAVKSATAPQPPGSDGANPFAGMIMDAQGNLFGAVFELVP
jgi:hypothetical protein